jgi:hypothetical protein
MKKLKDSVISSKGINGHIKGTKSFITIDKIKLELDFDTAWALCNLLDESTISKNTDKCQREGLINLGIAIGTVIDHGIAFDNP